jgi:hypothetical protein
MRKLQVQLPILPLEMPAKRIHCKYNWVVNVHVRVHICTHVYMYVRFDYVVRVLWLITVSV